MSDILAKYIAKLIAQNLRLTCALMKDIEKNLINNDFDEVEKLVKIRIIKAYSGGELTYKRSDEE